MLTLLVFVALDPASSLIGGDGVGVDEDDDNEVAVVVAADVGEFAVRRFLEDTRTPVQ